MGHEPQREHNRGVVVNGCNQPEPIPCDVENNDGSSALDLHLIRTPKRLANIRELLPFRSSHNHHPVSQSGFRWRVRTGPSFHGFRLDDAHEDKMSSSCHRVNFNLIDVASKPSQIEDPLTSSLREMGFFPIFQSLDRLEEAMSKHPDSGDFMFGMRNIEAMPAWTSEMVTKPMLIIEDAFPLCRIRETE